MPDLPHRVGVYPGTFDPVTNGHIDIVGRAARVVHHLVVGVAENIGKEPLFPLAERVELVQAEIVTILDRLGPAGFHRGRYASAARIVQEAATAATLPDFITAPAYDVLNALD